MIIIHSHHNPKTALSIAQKPDVNPISISIDPDLPNVEDQSNFEMASGNSSGSRFGIKGQEALDNGLTIGFVLENGFKSDDGSLGSDISPKWTSRTP